MKSYFYFILIVSSVFSSCQKEETIDYGETQYTEVSEISKSELIFGVGSFWVYKNDSNVTDSVVVEKLINGKTNICPRNGCRVNWFYSQELKSYPSEKSYNNYFTESIVKRNGGGGHGELGQPIFFGDINEEFNGLTFKEEFETYSVNGKIYNNVKWMHIAASNQYQKEFEYDTDLYFAMEVGLIKKVVYNNSKGAQTWVLTNYSLVK